MNTRRLASNRLASHRQSLLSSSSRSEATLGTFLMGQPPGRREMLRLIVAVDTVIPSSSSKASQCSSRVRSGLLRRWPANHSSSIPPLMAGGLGMGLGSTLPVSRRLFSQRLIEGKETPKILATSALGIPRSTASNTFTLRSFEYALISRSFTEDQVSRKPLSELAVPIHEKSRGAGLERSCRVIDRETFAPGFRGVSTWLQFRMPV